MIHVLATVPPGDFANGFGIALGFIIVVIILIFIGIWVTDGVLKNPFAPLVRWIDRWQVHRHEMTELKLRVKLKRDEPEYTAYLEQKKDDDV